MKNFTRQDGMFSLCGLNCALCPMKLGGYCPGCGGGEGNQGCAIARCSIQKGNYNYCFECPQYPCEKYNNITVYDSFITHQHQQKDMEKAKNIGIDAYLQELYEKTQILQFLLDNFNDGRRKTLFCLAVNLLELSDLQIIIKQLKEALTNNSSIQEKALLAAHLLNECASKNNIRLKLHKK